MSNPNKELFSALDKLEAFTKESSLKQTRLEEIKDLLQSIFFHQHRQKKYKQTKQKKKELQKSVGVIKNYLPLIDKYRSGNAEEQKLADLITRTIANYNEALRINVDDTESTNLRIVNTPSIAYKRGLKENKELIDTLFSSKVSPSRPISKEEKDTLKMKAIRLIEGEDSFKQSLIETIKDKELGEIQEIQNDGNTVTIMQTWSELPGEVHRIVGDFRRESKHSIPIVDSFKLFLESVQPGHPYPPQRMGWSLSHWLIPSSVLWIDQIPLLQPVLERKNRVAQELLPEGSLNLKARKLFRYKKNIFDTHRLEYLSYHQELAQSIVKASSYGDEKLFHKVITNFFEALSKLPAPFEALARSSVEMNRIYIEKPYEMIEEARLKGDYDDLFLMYDIERERLDQEYAEKPIKVSDPYEVAKKEYLIHMGRLIGESAALLLKLQLSEKLKVKPPLLSDFELKLQAAAFKHLIEFLEELESESDLDNPLEKEAITQRMRIEIASEIELFTVSFDDIDVLYEELTEETVSYYHAQFHAGNDS